MTKSRGMALKTRGFKHHRRSDYDYKVLGVRERGLGFSLLIYPGLI